MKATVPLFLSALVLIGGPSAARGATIVGLPEASAFYDITGGNELTSVPDPSDAAGLTMNVTFTPDATDIGQATNAVSLLEIGGNANGTGLYLLGGELHFLSKMQSAAGNVVAAFNDLDYDSGNRMVGVKSTFGPLAAGTEYSVGVVYDPNGASTMTMAVLPTGGSVFQETVNFVNADTTNGNWAGNNTVTSFNAPSNAGGGNTVAGNPFQEGAAMNALSGTAGRALMWNELGTVIPEPAGASLLAFGAALLGFRRRRPGRG